MFLGNKLGEQSTASGEIKTSHCTEQDCNQINGMGGVDFTQSDQEQQGGAKGKSDVTGHQEPTAVHPVEGMSGGQEEGDARQKLRQPNEPEGEGPFADF